MDLACLTVAMEAFDWNASLTGLQTARVRVRMRSENNIGALGLAAAGSSDIADYVTIRGVVWCSDIQTRTIVMLVPPPEFGGAVGPLPWFVRETGEMWDFEKGMTVQANDKCESPFCHAVVVSFDDVIEPPTVIDMEGDPLVEWWNGLLQTMASLPETAPPDESALCINADDKFNENCSKICNRLHEAAIPFSVRSDGCVSIFNGLASIISPFESPNDIIASDTTLAGKLSSFLFNVTRDDNKSPPNSTKIDKKVDNTVIPVDQDTELGVLEYLNSSLSTSECTIYTTAIHLPRYSRWMTKRVKPKTAPVPVKYASVPRKYYSQRYRYFCKFDHGIRIDEESWYSVTPETIAEHLSERCRSGVVLDLFAGCGGNAIQFAFTCEHVIAVEISRERVEIARSNAKVYGVDDRIEFIASDAISFLKSVKEFSNSAIDVVFMSPPWGGPEYINVEKFDIKDITVESPLFGKFNGLEVLDLALSVTHDVALFVPRTTYPISCCSVLNARYGQRAKGEKLRIELEQHIVLGKVKTCCIYFGELLAKRTLKAAGVLSDPPI